MMEPIDPNIQGIAYADQDNQGESFGMTRTKAIVDAILNLEQRSQNITFDSLLQEVEQCFRESNIDPKKPHMKRMVVETEEEIDDKRARYPKRRNEIGFSEQYSSTDHGYSDRNPGQDSSLEQRPAAWESWIQEAQRLEDVKRRQIAWIDSFPPHMRREAEAFIRRAEDQGPSLELAAELGSLNRRKDKY